MDTLTHGITGILLGKAFSHKIKQNKTASFLVVGCFASMFPDFDFLFRLISSEAYFLNHRGITHSLILLPIWSYLVSIFLTHLFYNKIIFKRDLIVENADKKLLQKEIFLLSLISILIHIVFDLITSYGTMILSPFNDYRFEYGSVFIIDFWFSGIILAGILFSYLTKENKHIPAICALFVLFSYIGTTQILKNEAETFAKEKLATVHNNPAELIVKSYPAPFSPFKWLITAHDIKTDNYLVASFNLIGGRSIFTLEQKNTGTNLPLDSDFWIQIHKWGNNEDYKDVVKIAWTDPDFKNYRWFYQVPAFDSIIRNDNKVCIYFKDLRFISPLRENPFIFGLCTTKNGKKYKSRRIDGVDTPI